MAVGARGPVPKRSEERHRRNEPASPVVKAAGAGEVPVPDADVEWHPIARRLWDATKESGQTRFYEPSDWALLYSLMDDLSYAKQCERRPAGLIESIYSQLGNLLISEGDRRRVQVELHRPSSQELEDAGVTEMRTWMEKFSTG